LHKKEILFHEKSLPDRPTLPSVRIQSAKILLHSAKSLPSATLDKPRLGKKSDGEGKLGKYFGSDKKTTFKNSKNFYFYSVTTPVIQRHQVVSRAIISL